MVNIPVQFNTSCDIPINVACQHQCSNIEVAYDAVEIPISQELFIKMVDAYFTNPNYTIIFDGGDADTCLGELDTMILL